MHCRNVEGTAKSSHRDHRRKHFKISTSRGSKDEKGSAAYPAGASEVKSVVEPREVGHPNSKLRQTYLVCFRHCHSELFRMRFRRRSKELLRCGNGEIQNQPFRGFGWPPFGNACAFTLASHVGGFMLPRSLLTCSLRIELT
jgi:hypothetical protein